MAWKKVWNTEEEYKCYQKKVIEHFADGCPICHGYKIDMLNSLTFRRIGKHRFQFFSVICNDCGFHIEFEVKRFMKKKV